MEGLDAKEVAEGAQVLECKIGLEFINERLHRGDRVTCYNNIIHID